MRSAILIIASSIATMVAGTVQPTMAAPGDLDPSFDGDGVAFMNFNAVSTTYGGAIAIQTDGKIIVGAQLNSDRFAVARYRADGRLDKSFGYNGIQAIDPGTVDAEFRAVTLQDDGKIIVVGSLGETGVDYQFVVVRLDTDGDPDATFGGGIVTTPIGGSSARAAAVAIQSDGKIVVGGSANGGGNYDFALVRYEPDGSLDTTFGSSGIVTTPVGPGDDEGTGVAIQTNGSIVLSGYWDDAGNAGFAVARYDTNGVLDTTFDVDGVATTDLSPGLDRAHAVAVQADDKILVVGEAADGTDADFAVVRYNVDGSLDAAFDGDGIVTTDFGVTSNRAYGVAIQADGRIVAVGDVSDFSQPNIFRTDIALARYNVDGSLDAGFGTNGVATTGFALVVLPYPFSGSYALATANAVAFQSDGKIVITGGRELPNAALVARYSVTKCGDGVLDPGETCDDGALVGGDGCDAGCVLETDCPLLPLPESACLTAAKIQLRISKADDPTKNRVTWRWESTDGLFQTYLGVPYDDTKYSFCLYDTTAGNPTLAARLDIVPGDTWTWKSPKGAAYDDEYGSPDGVQKVRIKTSYAGRASAKLSAKGENVPIPPPVSGSEYLDQDPTVIVQFVNEEGLCLTGGFTTADTTMNDGATFKAKAR